MKTLNLYAPITANTSYGIVSLNIAKCMAEKSKLYLHSIGQVLALSKEYRHLNALINNDFDPKADCVKIWHANGLKEQIGRGLHCGFPIFELDGFYNSELIQLKNLSKIFVTSNWAKKVLLENGIPCHKVHVIPLGVDRAAFNEQVKAKGIANTTTTKFFSIAKIEIRKCHDVLHTIFNKAFDKNDDVEFTLVWNNPFLPKEEVAKFEKMYKRTKMGEKINIVNHRVSDEDLTQIVAKSDCGVFLSRAEGWNLGCLEAMSMGKIVIATNNTGMTEYVDSKNSLLVETPDKEKAMDNIWFFGIGNWHKFGEKEINDAAEKMRFVHEQKQKGRLELNLAGIETAKRFSWERSADLILEHVQSET